MKMMPRRELISMLTNGLDNELISEEFIDRMFEYYGDDYFKEDNYFSDWKLCTENKNRKVWFEELELEKAKRGEVI